MVYLLNHLPTNLPKNVGFWISHKLEHLFGNVQSKRAWLIHGSFPICCSTQMGDHHSHHSSASGWRCGSDKVVSDVDSALFICYCWGTKNLYMGVSKNGGFSLQIIHFNRVFCYKPPILGVPLFFWKHPNVHENTFWNTCIYKLYFHGKTTYVCELKCV